MAGWGDGWMDGYLTLMSKYTMLCMHKFCLRLLLYRLVAMRGPALTADFEITHITWQGE